MKKFIVPVLCVCFFMSCSTDDTALNTVATTTDSASDGKITKKNMINPVNAANAYDYVGQLQAEILGEYLEGYPVQPAAAGTIINVEAVADSNPDFVSISSSYPGLNTTDVVWTMGKINYPDVVMGKGQLSVRGKLSMGEFIAMIDSFQNEPDNEVLVTIKNFETIVINDSYLNQTDKQVILSATSIARYSMSLTGNGERGWLKTKFGITASARCSKACEAITMSVTANLLSDNL